MTEPLGPFYQDPGLNLEGNPPSPQLIEQANILAQSLLASQQTRVEVELILNNRTVTGWAFFPSRGKELVIVTDDFIGLSNPEQTHISQVIPRKMWPQN